MRIKSVAIISASREAYKFSHKAVKAFQAAGYEVYPINPQAKEIAGLKAYSSLDEVSSEISEVSIYLPPELTYQILDELVGHNLKQMYLNPGSADDKVRTKVKELNLPVVEACSIRAQGKDPSDF